MAKMRTHVDGRSAMGERGTAESKDVRRIMTAKSAAALAVVAIVFGLAPDAHAQTSGGSQAGDALTAYAQANTQRSRTRIRVSPRCFYRTQPTPFPVPYDCEAPGPGFVRECRSWLVQEARPSGPVIVPEMRCWWVRG